MSLIDRGLAAMLPFVPRFIVGKVARRYVAGETIADAMRAVERVVDAGARATVDVLGEEIEDLGPVDETVREYRGVLDAIHDRGLDANISIKLTALGLRLDPERCRRAVEELVDHARSLESFVRIDMEDSSTTTPTLDLYRALRASRRDNTGVVLQACMRRTLDDIAALAEHTPSYRICKGIYVEPEEIAFKEPLEVNDAFMRAVESMFDGGSYVGIATHDRRLVEAAEKVIAERHLPPDAYEFQMLLGVEEALGREILSRGHRLRIYIPYGKDWYAYCVRRLKENPRIGRYAFLAMFKRR